MLKKFEILFIAEDARQKPVDSEPTAKPEIKTRSPKVRQSVSCVETDACFFTKLASSTFLVDVHSQLFKTCVSDLVHSYSRRG